MKLLKTYNANDFEPQDYIDRKVVRCVILDLEKNLVLLFGNLFVGGGVEENETDEIAIAREALEEIGAELKIVRPLGEIIAYRDILKKKYIIHGYICRYIKKVSEPTTTDPLEKNNIEQWFDIDSTIVKLESEINDLLKQDPTSFEGDMYQRKLYNRKVNMDFLKEALK